VIKKFKVVIVTAVELYNSGVLLISINTNTTVLEAIK